MTDNKKTETKNDDVNEFAENRGLSSASSGTEMPKVKEPKKEKKDDK